jgi:hypothetical protein
VKCLVWLFQVEGASGGHLHQIDQVRFDLLDGGICSRVIVEYWSMDACGREEAC